MSLNTQVMYGDHLCGSKQIFNSSSLNFDIAFRCAYCYHLNPARQTKPSVSSPAVTFLPSPSSSFLQEDESHKPDEEEKPNSVKDGKDETEQSMQAQPLTASVRES